jgi:small subunit ribosomal protein S6
MRLYDIIVLLTPDLSDEEAMRAVGDYRTLLTGGGGEVVKDDSWGRRKLAYPIGRKRDAWYHHFQVKAEPSLIAEAERRLRLSDQVLRHLAVRADEELRRSVKLSKRAQAKAARRPPRPVPPPTPAESLSEERSEPHE